MTWAFDVTSNIPRITQSGTDSGATPFAGIDTAIAAVGTVGRGIAYTTAQMVKPPIANGMWYRCSQAGTTSATAPAFDPAVGSVTTDGTAKFTAFRAPTPLFVGTGSIYFLPDVRVQYQGTLTNTNPQQATFWCWDIIGYGAAANFTSGSWAADGVTPLWDGLHFVSTRVGPTNADPASLSLQAGAKATFIGGEVQVAAAMGFDNATEPKFYQTRLRGTKEWGTASTRIRSYTTLLILDNCEFFDIALDLFRMPAVAPTVKGRGCEYLFQYVGAGAGGADAKFVTKNLENASGAYALDNYFGGWVEIEDCKDGAALSVVSQYPNSAIWVKHFVPLYQNIVITAKDTGGNPVNDVRFSCTDTPNNSPTVTFTTAGGLKTWDARNPFSYQFTSGTNGQATERLMLKANYWQTSFKVNLRFPASTAVPEARAYGYKSTTVSIVLGVGSVINKDVGMIARDTATVLDRAAALAQTGITFTPSGATGGTVVITGSKTLQQVWDYYNAWIIEFTNRSSNDTWTCIGEILNAGAWSFSVPSGSELLSTNDIESLKTTGTVTNAGTIDFPFQDADGLRATVTGLDPEGFGITWFLRHRPVGGSTWTNISGTGNAALVLLAPGSYDMQVRAPGYEWESALLLNTEVSLSLNAGLRYQVSANNTPQYTMAFDAALEAIFQYDATAMKVSVANATAGILQPGFAELYQATQRIQHIPGLVWTWTAPLTANATSQKILIPDGNPISMFLTDASTNTVKITCPVIHADTGSSADDRVRGNPAGYSIILGSPATAESAGLASQIISGLGGPNYDAADHSLSVIKADQDLAKAVLDLVQVAVDAVKAKTDNLPAAPAAVGSAMTLTSAYDAAKTAASQASVDALLEVTAPTPEQIRTELEKPGSKLDKAMKAAQSAEDQTA